MGLRAATAQAPSPHARASGKGVRKVPFRLQAGRAAALSGGASERAGVTGCRDEAGMCPLWKVTGSSQARDHGETGGQLKTQTLPALADTQPSVSLRQASEALGDRGTSIR